MTRYRVMYAGEDGWCDWIHPLPGYKMACCDCGLVHDMEFDYIKKDKRIVFRARRNARATAAARRKHRKDQK
jgi:hypothetical protein